ncbi:MAG: Creatinine amidohydrolase [Methanomassiliicoccales archaeon PtaU1.Bin124]|nr:MAG: Creatinine amidohydrolase [Methanomassiliicoccales archaeon PtaU1.Bin124]
MRIAELTSDEFAESVRSDPVVIIPFGAIEAHGPHLPLSTDCIQPVAMAEIVADLVGGLVAPLVPYGQHSSTKKMPGTIGISMETLKALAVDIMESLVANGVKKIVVLSGHAGSIHIAALKSACEEIAEMYDVKVMMLSDYFIADEMTAELCGGRKDGHGGLVETSRIMALRPDLVKEVRPVGTSTEARYVIDRHPETRFPQQCVGHAKDASQEAGEKVNTYVAEKLSDLILKNMG